MNQFPKIGLIICLLVFGELSFAQKNYVTYKEVDKNVLEIYKKGTGYANTGRPAEAIKQFQKALKSAPTFIDAKIMIADCKYGLNNLEEARKEFEAVLLIDSLYRKKVLYTLGSICAEQKDYLQSAAYYDRFVAIENGELAAKAKLLSAQSRFLATATKTTVPFKPINMGDNINSANYEYLPTITADGETLLFTTRLGRNEDFFIAKKKEGIWQKAVNLGAPINTTDNEGAETISSNGKYFIYTACNRPNGVGSCDLVFSEFKDNKWTEPQNLGASVNSKDWDSQPTLSSDGKLLIFSSSRAGSVGGRNLWQAIRLDNGKWSQATEIKELNTDYDEISPFLHQDGTTLYFASNGHPGFGDNDLFIVKKKEDGTWGTPVNMGSPINSDKNEMGLIVSLDGKTAIYAAEFGDTRGGTDLYTFELPEKLRAEAATYVKATVTDAETKNVLKGVVVKLREVGKTNVLTEIKTDEVGEFLLCLPKGKNYDLSVSEKGYLFYSDNFELTDKNTVNTPQILNIALQKIPVMAANSTTTVAVPVTNKAIILKNVFFETGSAALKSASLEELNRLRDLLKENMDLKIQISGHTDNQGSDAMNMTLSENRAKAVKEYLIGQGINSSRLSSKGFGKTQPIDTNDTEAGRKNNRRTEFIVHSN